MNINYKRFELNGELISNETISFIERNIIKIERKYYSYSNKKEKWYTIYDLKREEYNKYYAHNNELFAEGQISFGRWSVDQLSKDIEFIKYEPFMGYDALQCYEVTTGMVSQHKYLLHCIHNALVLDYIDEKYISFLPISVVRRVGKEFKDYGILGSATFLHDRLGAREMFKIQINSE